VRWPLKQDKFIALSYADQIVPGSFVNGDSMKKASKPIDLFDDRDTMRREYDFSGAVRGLTAARYAQGANVVVVDPDVIDVFPNSAAVNDALRALAPLIRHRKVGRRSRLTRCSSRPRPRKGSGVNTASGAGRGA
jgi:hypothetical protein